MSSLAQIFTPNLLHVFMTYVRNAKFHTRFRSKKFHVSYDKFLSPLTTLTLIVCIILQD